MPFQSKAQARYLYSQEPEVAARWEKHTSRRKRKRLPEHVGKSQLAGAGRGFKAITQMAPKERSLLRRQITHNPVERFREPAKRLNSVVRQDIKPGARRAHAEYARQAIDEGETLGVAYRTGPGKAKVGLAHPSAFDKEARLQNKLARAKGVKKPGYTGQQMRDVTNTHEMHHANELVGMPRKTELQHAYTNVHNPARADAHHAAMEGRAVGQANAVHGALPSNYDQTYKVPRGVKAKQNMAGSTRREATAYHAAKANPNTLLHRFGKAVGETPTQRYQRHQHQAAAALTATAAIPALLALRSGRMASTAMASKNPIEHAVHASAQLKHAASATALGGLAGAANAMPTPRRLLTQNPKRDKGPKVKRVKVGPRTSLHRPASGRPPARGYTKGGIGKANDVDAFGVDRSDMAKAVTPKQASQERVRHYRNMAGTMSAVGLTSAGLGTGTGIVGRMETKGKDPMGFAGKATHRSKPVSPVKRAAILGENAAAHGEMRTALGVIGAGALGAAGAYKVKQRHEQKRLTAMGKALGPQGQKRTRQAGDVGLGAASAGLGVLALTEGGHAAHTMNRHAKHVQSEVLGARKAIAAHKAGTAPLTPKALEFAQHQQSKGLKVFAVKKPAALAAGTIAAAGGAGLYEVGRHVLASRREQVKKDEDMIDAFGVDRDDIVKRGVHVYDPDSPESKAATKKHKGKFHPKFLHHMGAHRFDHTKENPQEKKDDSFKSKTDDKPAFVGKFPPKKGHKQKKDLPVPFGKLAPVPGQPKKHPYQNSAFNTSAVATGLAGLRHPGITASGHMMQATNLPKLIGGAGRGHHEVGGFKAGMSRLGSPELGTSATGAGIHAGRMAEGNVGAKALKGAGAFARAIPKSPGAAIAAGGAGAGLAIGGAIAHHRKQKALKAAVPGYASKSISKKKSGEYDPKWSMKSQGLAFTGKEARKTAVHDTRLNMRVVRSGPSTAQNRKTLATGAKIGGAVGGAVGAGYGAKAGLPGALAGGATGALVGAAGGADIAHTYVNQPRAFKGAVNRGIKYGGVSTGNSPKKINRFTGQLKKSYPAPPVPDVWNRPTQGLVSERMVDGIPESRHAAYLERLDQTWAG